MRVRVTMYSVHMVEEVCECMSLSVCGPWTKKSRTYLQLGRHRPVGHRVSVYSRPTLCKPCTVSDITCIHVRCKVRDVPKAT